MKWRPIIALSTLMLTNGARAQTAAPDATAAAAPDPSQKLVCVRSDADTGSHFGAGKVCHTESEWTMIRNQSRRTMERYDSLQSKQAPPGGR